jgi:RNA polymerase sigma-70 factor (ECF subfamily)
MDSAFFSLRWQRNLAAVSLRSSAESLRLAGMTSNPPGSRLPDDTESDAAVDLLARWRAGDEQAAAELFHCYASRLTAVARGRLSARLANHIDAEDVVQSAYRSFFVGAREGRFDVRHGGDLWRLLVAITVHKLQHQVERELAQKRSVHATESFGSEDVLFGIRAEVLAREPSPLEALTLVDQLEVLLRGLEPLQRRMVELRLQGHDLDEIATRTQRCRRTVGRVLEHVRQRLAKWEEESNRG